MRLVAQTMGPQLAAAFCCSPAGSSTSARMCTSCSSTLASLRTRVGTGVCSMPTRLHGPKARHFVAGAEPSSCLPQPAGNVARTCAATNVGLHLVGPLGFELDSKK